MNISFSLISLIFGAFLLNVISADEPTATQSLSFEYLANITDLASCIALIKDDFANCNKDAEERSKVELKGIDEKSELALKVKCCGIWRLRDCWERAAKLKCKSNEVKQVHNLPNVFAKNLTETCKNYPDGSSKCK